MYNWVFGFSPEAEISGWNFPHIPSPKKNEKRNGRLKVFLSNVDFFYNTWLPNLILPCQNFTYKLLSISKVSPKNIIGSWYKPYETQLGESLYRCVVAVVLRSFFLTVIVFVVAVFFMLCLCLCNTVRICSHKNKRDCLLFLLFEAAGTDIRNRVRLRTFAPKNFPHTDFFKTLLTVENDKIR